MDPFASISLLPLACLEEQMICIFVRCICNLRADTAGEVCGSSMDGQGLCVKTARTQQIDRVVMILSGFIAIRNEKDIQCCDLSRPSQWNLEGKVPSPRFLGNF